MTVNVAAGSILSIATAPNSGVSTLTAILSDYLAMTWQVIGEVEAALGIDVIGVRAEPGPEARAVLLPRRHAPQAAVWAAV